MTKQHTTNQDSGRRDFGSLRLRGRIWYIRYRVDGREYWESAHSTSQRQAEKLLARRQAELGLGVFTAPDAKRVTFADLAEIIRDDYRVKGRRSLPTLKQSLTRLAKFFGNCRALGITADRVTAYERDMLDAGYARATVNKDLAALRRALNLAVKARRLPASAKPAISTPSPRNARTGFFELEDFARVLAELPEPLRPVMQFAYWTGWRTYTEVLTLTWDRVDFRVGVVRLDPNTTKTDEGRVFPFDALPELRTSLEQQRAQTRAIESATRQIVPWVFHRNGNPIKSYATAWRSACRRAAIEKRDSVEVVVRPHLLDRIPHDFRRTAVRNLVRAGVTERVAMQLTGHKTRSVFDRYDIVNEADLRAGVARLAAHTAGASRGTTGGQSGFSASEGTA